MSLLRIANSNSKKISLSDDGDYIEVLEDVSKKTFNDLVMVMPQDIGENGLTIGQAIEFSRELFRSFVTGWSLDVAPTVDNYDLLTRGAADAIDTAVAKHFESLTPSQEESSKSEGPSKAPRRRA